MPRPTHREYEIGPRYGTITKYKTFKIRWIHPRLGLCYKHVIVYNPDEDNITEMPINTHEEILCVVAKILEK